MAIHSTTWVIPPVQSLSSFLDFRPFPFPPAPAFFFPPFFLFPPGPQAQSSPVRPSSLSLSLQDLFLSLLTGVIYPGFALFFFAFGAAAAGAGTGAGAGAGAGAG